MAVAIGDTSELAEPWGIASDVSSTGLFVRTEKTVQLGTPLRLWFLDGNRLRGIEARVSRECADGVAVSFDDQAFYHWAFDRVAEH